MYEYAIMHGANAGVRTRYDTEIAVMKEMHWSYDDYLSAPEDMIEVIEFRIHYENKWRKVKADQDRD